jgi:hypothetical protein
MGDGRILSRCHCDNTSGSSSNGMDRRVAHILRQILVSNKEECGGRSISKTSKQDAFIYGSGIGCSIGGYLTKSHGNNDPNWGLLCISNFSLATDPHRRPSHSHHALLLKFGVYYLLYYLK